MRSLSSRGAHDAGRASPRSTCSASRARASHSCSSCWNRALVTASVAAATLAPHSRARRCKCADRAVIGRSADEPRGLLSIGTAPFRGDGEGTVLVCSEPAQGINSPLPRRVAGTSRVLTGRAERSAALTPVRRDQYAREMSTVRALVRYQSGVAGKRSDGDYVLHRGPHLEHERGLALGVVATVPRSLR
jgi:hypothetical protein